MGRTKPPIAQAEMAAGKAECRMCDHWRHIPIRYWFVRGKRTVRSCLMNKRKEVMSDSPACDNFLIADYFTCNKWSFTTQPAICQGRLAKKECPVRCSDGSLAVVCLTQ